MLTAVTLTQQAPHYAQTHALYQRAFPENERGPLAKLLNDTTGHSEVIAFCDDDVFCGFACLLTYEDITHILYFAIDETMRGTGYGSAALALIKARKPQNRIIADIEAADENAENNQQRKKRKQFYLRNGYALSRVTYTWQHEAYEIVVQGGTLTAQEFEAFWKHVEVVNGEFAKF